jgi:hypothetical protein
MADVHLRNLDVLKDTDKAYQFRQHQRGGQYVDFWIPKSQIGNNTKYKDAEKRLVRMDVSIPEWLFEQKTGVQDL